MSRYAGYVERDTMLTLCNIIVMGADQGLRVAKGH